MLRFKVGENVMARWPGTQLYYKATVKDISEEDKTADVLFEDGTEMDLPFENIKVSAVSFYTPTAPAFIAELIEFE